MRDEFQAQFDEMPNVRVEFLPKEAFEGDIAKADGEMWIFHAERWHRGDALAAAKFVVKA